MHADGCSGTERLEEVPGQAGVKGADQRRHAIWLAVHHVRPADEVDCRPDQSLIERLTHVAKLVCSVNATQLTAIQKAYRTSTASLTIDNRSVQVVSVYGANEKSIRGYLGDTQCVLVQVAQVFFLPFDAHTS